MGRLQIAVVGGGRCSREVSGMAELLGEALARRGATVVCGGLGGVMAAVAKGARRAGTTVLGILPSYDATTANSDVTVVVPSGLGFARNVLVVAAGDAVVALPGESGTLSEIALALKLGRPVVGLGAWGNLDGVVAAADPEMAAQAACRLAAR